MRSIGLRSTHAVTPQDRWEWGDFRTGLPAPQCTVPDHSLLQGHPMYCGSCSAICSLDASSKSLIVTIKIFLDITKCAMENSFAPSWNFCFRPRTLAFKPVLCTRGFARQGHQWDLAPVSHRCGISWSRGTRMPIDIWLHKNVALPLQQCLDHQQPRSASVIT